MPYKTLITPDQLNNLLSSENIIIIDSRPNSGTTAYLENHIQGAVYVDLETDLSGPPLTDKGRHPLPSPEAMTALFGQLGIDGTKQVVVYDANNGAFAARLWWMLRYMGHKNVAVLNGGWTAWQTADLPISAKPQVNEPVVFLGEPRRDRLITYADLSAVELLIDSREAGRYRGEYEPLDPVAGHIPNAQNYHFANNWDENGRFLSPEELMMNHLELLDETAAEDAVFYCGSGVTACCNLLAQAHAGLPESKLYVGSWSEYCRVAEL